MPATVPSWGSMPESLPPPSDATPHQCFVVGMGSLAIACCQILQKRGFQILGICSPDGSLANFASETNIAHESHPRAFAKRLLGSAYEWLFSLNNPWIIPEDVATRARLGSINYHDSPLPRYAGLHATAWALMAGETRHAITFHEVTASIDGGRILAQTEVPVTDTDTSFSLNVRCFETALTTFDALAHKLSGVGSRSQVPYLETATGTMGSYFGRSSRPTGAAILDFRRDAESLRNLVRALDFGSTHNPLAVPKLYAKGHVFAVRRAELRPQLGAMAPGALVEVTSTGLTFGTASVPVHLAGFETLQGRPLTVEQVVEDCGLRTPMILEAPPDALLDQLTSQERAWAKNDGFWRGRLEQQSPLDLGISLSSSVDLAEAYRLVHLERAIDGTFGADRLSLSVTSLALLCARLSGEPDLSLGMAVAEVCGVAALAMSPVVPMRIELLASMDLGEVRQAVTCALETTRKHGTYSLDLVARAPQLRNKPATDFVVGFGEVAHPDVLSCCQLYFAIDSQSQQVSLHHAGRLSLAQAEALDRSLGALSTAIQTAQNTPWSSVSLLDAATRQVVLYDWNRTDREFPRASVYEMVAVAMARYPNATAVRFGSESLTYRELEARAIELASALHGLGVREGDVVAVSVHRSCDVVVALLGILRAGAAYLPIDPSYPDERGHAMLARAGVKVAVCHAELKSRFFAGFSTHVLTTSAARETPSVSRTSADVLPALRTSPDDVFCVIYTSGSTGQPKGVEVTHRGLVNHSCAIAENYGLGVGDRVLCSASISFDVTGEQIYPALFSGAEVVIRSNDLFDSFQGFAQFVRQYGLTVMILPTAFWHEWVRDLTHQGDSVPESLRVLSVGTEKALGESLAQWQRASQGRVRFCQGYGPTETTITSTMYILKEGRTCEDDPLPIGRPLPNTRLYVLDDNLEPVPVGAKGSLYIAGHGLARGYRNAPELTESRFLPCPFEPGNRMYATGDQVRYREDGQLVFIGRSDSQVKIRGFRVELGEVEQTLRQHPAVEEALVLLRTVGDEPILCGYVVSRTSSLTGSELQQFLAQKLPAHEVPRAVYVLPSFPKTTNQKVDKSALPLPTFTRATLESTSSSPSTKLQTELAHLWSELLGGVAVRAEDNFFDLGGNSLLAIRLLSEIAKVQGSLVLLSQFVRDPTVRGLEAALKQSGDDASLVITVQRGRSPVPLWVIHPVGGHVVYANTLRRHMSPEITIHGIQAQGVDGKQTPIDRIEDMAALYVEQMRRIQPHGPYVLAGPSMGGLIALEVAQRLQAAGEPIGLLVMLDTWGPGYPRPTSRWARHWDQLQNVRQQPDWASRLSLLRARVTSRLRTPRSGDSGFVPPRYDVHLGESTNAEVQATLQQVYQAHERANLSYSPAPFAGRTILLRASEPMKWSGMRFDDPQNGWGGLMSGHFDVVHIPCAHSQLADDPPAAAAYALETAMCDALGWSPDGPKPDGPKPDGRQKVPDAPTGHPRPSVSMQDSATSSRKEAPRA